MAIHRKWQRGTADLTSVAVGLIILSIVTAGTSAALVYGRETLLREEHYKAAAYLLRGYMEAQQTALQITQGRRDLAGGEVAMQPLDLSTDRINGVQQVYCSITRDRIQEHRAEEIGGQFAFYRITMHATWMERNLAENRRTSAMRREVTFTTSTIPRVLL
jgi:hypothetical protein